MDLMKSIRDFVCMNWKEIVYTALLVAVLALIAFTVHLTMTTLYLRGIL